ncbi:cell division protein [Pseudomonas sp. TUM22785]|uniref:cell division protein n=1 Tax=Pseudomonas sp. TUM22785 TaxID=3019098 RepID=UPI0023067608|nr:cell division protein [Pseudomonas sp. TUM22785]WCD83632.1 cell division protein [Pseudomonas sp. TUM22785]
MTTPHARLRQLLVYWLYAAAFGHLCAGLVLTWFNHLPLFEAYQQGVEHAFWTGAVPAGARDQQLWWQALFGATMQSYAVFMFALVRIGDRGRNGSAWGWMMVGILLWAPQDMLLSAQRGIWAHLWVDGFALLALLPPLAWLYRHDRRTSSD